MYTDPKRLECGHVFCHQCLLDKNGPAECPDPDCRRMSVPDREMVKQLRTDMDMLDGVRQLIRKGKRRISCLLISHESQLASH